MKDKDEKEKEKEKKTTTTDSKHGRSSTATAVEESPPPGVRREFRLPRNSLDKELAEQLVAQACEDGVDLVDPDGLFVRDHRPAPRGGPRS